MMSYDGRAIANYILDFCDQRDRKVTNLSLQKIIYFCHVWSLIKLGKPLIKHKFEAWEYGPVLQYLYREFKSFDRNSINTRAKKLNTQTGQEEKVPYSFDSETQNLLETIVDSYSKMEAGHLVRLSHEVGGPWDKVWNSKNKINPGMVIEDDEIVRFYSKDSSSKIIQ